MTPETENRQAESVRQAEFQELLREKMRHAVRLTLIEVLEEEVSALIGAQRYERTTTRHDQRNGYYTRDLGTSVGTIVDLPVPRTRKGFRTSIFARYRRRQAELDEAIGEMFVYGVSMRRVGEVVEGLTGDNPSPSTVSRVFHTLEGEFQIWKERPLEAEYRYAFADGTYFTVIYDAQGCKTPILAVMGITLEGKRELLAFTVGDRENQQAWEDLLDDLKRRGVQRVGLWVSDGHQALINALELKFPEAVRQRCAQHKIGNVLGYVPKQQQKQVAPELKALFYQDDREQAEQAYAAFCAKYESIYPTAVACLQRDHEACFSFYAFPKEHWRTIRTNNVIERLFNEVKRRSHKMAAAFRNENSCLLLFYAVVRTLRFHRLPEPAK